MRCCLQPSQEKGRRLETNGDVEMMIGPLIGVHASRWGRRGTKRRHRLRDKYGRILGGRHSAFRLKDSGCRLISHHRACGIVTRPHIVGSFGAVGSISVTVQTMRRRVATGLVRRVHRRVLGRGGLGGCADLAQYRQGYAHHHQEGEQARQRAICPKRRNHAGRFIPKDTVPIHQSSNGFQSWAQ